MVGMDHSTMIAQPHSHGMYTMTHQPLNQMYYDLDSSVSAPHTNVEHHHHISDHLPSIPSQQVTSRALTVTQQSQPQSQGSQANNHQHQQSSPGTARILLL